jgi:hypothetical protein
MEKSTDDKIEPALDEWSFTCAKAIRDVASASLEKQGETAIKAAQDLLALAIELSGTSIKNGGFKMERGEHGRQ